MKKTNKIIIAIFIILTILGRNFIVNADENISIDAKSSLVVENKTGKIIYENNSEEKLYPASTTKILTAIITIEKCNLEDVATVSSSAISNIPNGYVVAPLYVGEQIKIKDLLYALMLKSSNDAAYVLAEHVGGSTQGFADMMNKKAEEIGCKNSHFVNPNGIHDDNHYTTAHDLYLITNYAMKNETFAKIVSTMEYTLPATNKYSQANRIMKNTNLFMNSGSKYYSKYVNGVKTGTTQQAGNCLITHALKDEMEFTTVVLGAKTTDSKFSETAKLLNYSLNNFTYTKIHEKNDEIKKVEIPNAKDNNKELNILIGDEVKVFNNINTNAKETEPEIKLNDNLFAPIAEGQEIGEIKYNVEGIEYKAKLIAGNNIEAKNFFEENKTVVIIVVIMGIITLIFFKKKNKKKRRRRR